MATNDALGPDIVLSRIRDNVATYLGVDGRNPKYADIGELVMFVRALDRHLTAYGCSSMVPSEWGGSPPSGVTLEDEIAAARALLMEKSG